MATSKQSKIASIYQLKISLRGSRPPIWRRVQVNSDITLAQLHEIVQVSMGWGNCHLHTFSIQGVEYGRPQPEYDFNVSDERRAKLSTIATQEKAKFHYTYDMGDDWEHEILVEKILPPDPELVYPVCIKGKGACPPEDCGGVWGYQELLGILQQPEHPEHESMAEWIDEDFDPTFFDLVEVNESLHSL
ncbi:MAG: plasmid pRiA4b ORF-3 family protein [Chamaesiphon sp. CSU_1_12]|nr:plasmid pRiA4b ORF-3 family protein [Chamaesiphon sp. CSU_1_12]